MWNLFGNLELWDRIAQIKAPLEIKAQKHGAWPNLKGYNVHYVNLAPKASCESFSVSGCPWQMGPKKPEFSPINIGQIAESVLHFKTLTQWSQALKVLSSKEAKEPPIPPQFKKLLKKYEEITTCYLKAREVKHRGTHHINTQHIDD